MSYTSQRDKALYQFEKKRLHECALDNYGDEKSFKFGYDHGVFESELVKNILRALSEYAESTCNIQNGSVFVKSNEIAKKALEAYEQAKKEAVVK